MKILLSLSIVLASVLLVSTVSTVYAQSNPNSPLPIVFDKNSYTWTEKVKFKITAPEWNKDPSVQEYIGDKEGEHIIVYTREYRLEPYRLVESAPNSGIFVGEVQLTGFSHDVNGDRIPDTKPETSGVGPFDGKIQTKKGDGITVSFESDRKVYSSASAQIRWNIGEIWLDKESYFVDEDMVISVQDPDMNLDSKLIDTLRVTVSSDSDPAGFAVTLEETEINSGIFRAKTSFLTKENSFQNTLYVLPPDSIYIKYKDRTLPPPYSKDDILTVQIKSSFYDSSPVTSRVAIENSILKNRIDLPVTTPKVGRQLEVTSDLNNKQNYKQDFVYLVQVTNEDGKVVSFSWLNGSLNPYQILNIGVIWQPMEAGLYKVETFVWKSLGLPIPLSKPVVSYYEVIP